MKSTESKQILEYLKRIDESINGPRPKKKPEKKARPLSDRVDGLASKVGRLAGNVTALDNRVSEVQLGLATLAADTKAEFKRIDDRFERVDKRFDAIDVKFKHVDRRFNQVDQKIELARGEIVDLVKRVHDELTKRVIDLEVPEPGRKGNGGRGSGGGGVPLAS